MLQDEGSLLDIYKAGKNIIEFTQALTLEELKADKMRLKAVLYDFIVIGEATRRLSSELRDEHPEIPWKKMAGMRNILAHQYDNVDSDLLWAAIQTDVPEVLENLLPLLPSYFLTDMEKADG